jgi:hypothetical protein
MQPVKIKQLSIEPYDTINSLVKELLIDYLSLDSYYLTDDLQFQRAVELYYTDFKFDSFRDDVWYMTRVVDYKLVRTLNPLTKTYDAILPPDFTNYWPGYDKHIKKAGYIYNTSTMTGENTCYISYRRYIRDIDPLISIPRQFYDFMAIKLALRLNINNRFKTTNFDVSRLEVELGIQKQKALAMDLALFNTL